MIPFILLVIILFGQGCIFVLYPLSGLIQSDLPDRITFSDGLCSYTYSMSDWGLGITCNLEEEVFSGYLLVCRDEKKLSEGLEGLSALVNRPARSAAFKMDEQGQISITPAVPGMELDMPHIRGVLTGGTLYQKKYPLVLNKTEPPITKEKLLAQQPDTLWAQYSTILADIPDRTANVIRACSFLDDLIIAPGQVFSLNEQVGPRDIERGFRAAMVIVGGRFEPGSGGGVCQVSSTLYNAVLLAGLEIKERHNHSVRIAYVPLGRDAAVLYGAKDFKFCNNTPGYIMLRTRVEGLKLEISVYGNGPNPYDQVDIAAEELRTVPAYDRNIPSDTLASGERILVEKGQKGYYSRTYRKLRQGQATVTQLLSRDYYLPQPNVYAVGTKS